MFEDVLLLWFASINRIWLPSTFIDSWALYWTKTRKQMQVTRGFLLLLLPSVCPLSNTYLWNSTACQSNFICLFPSISIFCHVIFVFSSTHPRCSYFLATIFFKLVGSRRSLVASSLPLYVRILSSVHYHMRNSILLQFNPPFLSMAY